MRNTYNENEIGSKHIDKKRKPKKLIHTRKKNQIVKFLDVNMYLDQILGQRSCI